MEPPTLYHNTKIQRFFNRPSAPPFGGVWEILVKSAKKSTEDHVPSLPVS